LLSAFVRVSVFTLCVNVSERLGTQWISLHSAEWTRKLFSVAWDHVYVTCAANMRTIHTARIRPAYDLWRKHKVGDKLRGSRRSKYVSKAPVATLLKNIMQAYLDMYLLHHKSESSPTRSELDLKRKQAKNSKSF
jgi:hypothetical protein